MKQKATPENYCQYILVTQTNYTLTHFAEHSEHFSHDMINRMLAGEKVTARTVREQVQHDVVQNSNAFVIFDDTVLDKNHSQKIELVRRQWSGNEKRVIKGVGVVNCVYANPELNQFWMIDYRIYNPDGNGKSKLDHVQERLSERAPSEIIPNRVVYPAHGLCRD